MGRSLIVGTGLPSEWIGFLRLFPLLRALGGLWRSMKKMMLIYFFVVSFYDHDLYRPCGGWVSFSTLSSCLDNLVNLPPIYLDCVTDGYDDGVCDDAVQYVHAALHRSDGSLFDTSLILFLLCNRHAFCCLGGFQSCALLRS
jgi:hypothetical protein